MATFNFSTLYIRAITGHTDPETTKKYYIDPSNPTRQALYASKWRKCVETRLKWLDDKFDIKLASRYYSENEKTRFLGKKTRQEVEKLRLLIVCDPTPLHLSTLT